MKKKNLKKKKFEEKEIERKKSVQENGKRESYFSIQFRILFGYEFNQICISDFNYFLFS